MEKVNKSLIFIIVTLIAAIVCVILSSNNVMKSSNDTIVTTTASMNASMNASIASIMDSQHNKNLEVAPHPYNQCIKLLIDQTNKENKEADFDKIKSVCFELAPKDLTKKNN